MIIPIFFNGTLISSAACGITSNPIKKNGVITATLMIAFIVVDALSPANNCGARLLLSPLTTDATIKRIPTPPIITVKTVCKVAAVLAPLILINVINKATIIATASHDA